MTVSQALHAPSRAPLSESPPPTAASVSSAAHSHRRNRPFVLSVVLCTFGLIIQISNVLEFQSTTLKTSKKQKKTKDRQLVNTHMTSTPYFVPSLDYSFKGRHTEYAMQVQELQQKCENAPVRDLEWETYAQDSNSTSVMIGLFAGFDKYATLLSESAVTAKLYAQHHANTQVTILQGTAFAPGGCQPPGIHTTFNKMRLLFHALDQPQYQYLLLMEADSILTNLDIDFSSLISSDSVVAGQVVRTKHDRHEPGEQYHINAGVTLWNLHHPLAKDVALQWLYYSKRALTKGQYHGDGKFLPMALEKHKAPVTFLDEEFHFHKGTVVQHFQRGSSVSSKKSQLELARSSVCDAYQEDCNALYKSYPTI